MRDPGKQSGSIASALKGLFSGIKNGRTRFLAYGFVFAFVACTAFLAFCPSGSASPWFNRNFFSTSSISSSKDSNRSQVSSLFSYIFSNSSSGSSRDHLNSIASQWHGQVGVLPMVNRTEMGVGSRGDGISGDGRVEKGVGSLKDGVLGKNQTEVGVGLHGNGVSGKNLTEDRIGSRENGVSAENKTEGGVGSEKDRVLARKNQTVSGIGSLGSVVPVRNQTEEGVLAAKNQTGIGIASQENGVLVNNQTEVTVGSKESVVVPVNNQTEKGVGTHKNGVFAKNQTGETPAITKHNSNFTASPMKPNGPAASLSNSDYSKREESINSLMNCDIFQGRWVRDKSYPLYPAGSCPHIDEAFNCYLNGRPDRAYQKLRWQPNGCNIPRLNATDMLERLRGKRLVFVGDSLNRNMWQSLVCVLRNSVKDKKKVFEASGNRQFRTEGFYSFLFKDYNCAIEFFPAPFLVQEWEIQGPKGKRKETLRLDVIERSSSKYKDANVIVFNTGHWWTHEKTSKGKDYYQEGNHVYSELKVDKAFHKALSTWAKWVDANLNPKKTLVFFRGYSATHFSGGRWNSGGKCNGETEPIKNETYLSSYPPKMSILETVLKGMRTPVSYLNITRMTDYRKDAHPSIYRKQRPSEEERRSPERYQDCSHWCLPGLPDSWNELLYTQLLIKQH